MLTNSTKIISIAMVDDQAIFRKGLSDVIARFPNFRLDILVDTTEELISEISKTDKAPDICIVGINKIQFNDHTIISTIRKAYPDTKILALSVYDHRLNVIRIMEHGANSFLSKNVNAKKLQQALLSIYYTGSFTEGKFDDPTKESFITITEARILNLLSQDISYEEISAKLNIAVANVESYEHILCKKLNVTSRIGLIVSAHMMGIR